MSISKPTEGKVDCHRDRKKNLICNNSSFVTPECLFLSFGKLNKWSQMAAHTYKCCVFHQELRLIAVCVAFQDVSIPVLEDDFFI